MRALLQRVSSASVAIDDQTVGAIDRGLLVFLGVQRGDSKVTVDKLFDRIINYRIFNDIDGKMNLSVKDVNGDLLIVSQFTLVADTDRGRRPGFTAAAEPSLAKELYDHFIARAQLLSVEAPADLKGPDNIETLRIKVAAGIFGADMKISLVNDGPVTFMLDIKPDS